MRVWTPWNWHASPAISGDPLSQIVYLTQDIAGPRIPLMRRGDVMAEALRLAEAGAVVVVPTKSPDVLGDSLPERLIPALLARTQAELEDGIGRLAPVNAHCCALWLRPTEAISISRSLTLVQPTHDDPLADAMFQSAVDAGLADGPMAVNWVVVDGADEPMDPTCIRTIRDQCAAAGVPFAFLGWGSWCPHWHVSAVGDAWRARDDARYFDDGTIALRKWPAYSGAMLDLVAHDQRPAVAR